MCYMSFTMNRVVERGGGGGDGKTHCFYLLFDIKHGNKCILLEPTRKIIIYEGTIRYGTVWFGCLPGHRLCMYEMESLP